MLACCHSWRVLSETCKLPVTLFCPFHEEGFAVSYRHLLLQMLVNALDIGIVPWGDFCALFSKVGKEVPVTGKEGLRETFLHGLRLCSVLHPVCKKLYAVKDDFRGGKLANGSP